MLRKQTTYLSKELKHVKNGLYWCIPAFYAPTLLNTGKIHY
ncbi:hypothetical protein E2C01_067250 [Portunus trituberculatus]|uniref:Uncharacterized protein n=1 Tax=Portunus trituberculatus TaxID=210409 RepID=A0A5B7HT94_PORTR|nr:hypothetical protein [Portunus trituberculatus]